MRLHAPHRAFAGPANPSLAPPRSTFRHGTIQTGRPGLFDRQWKKEVIIDPQAKPSYTESR